jgi:triosephosphate isomerase
MRKPFIAGNWKMNLLTAEAIELARAVVAAAEGLEVEVGIAPTYTAISAVGSVLKGSKVRLMAQNLFWEDKGAFTGEISAPMIEDLGCTHVIIGHSERRQFFGETDETVNRRLAAALKHGLVPIVCIGETLAEREANRTLQVLEAQVRGGLKGLTAAELKSLVVAYEPVWAIGTGKTAGKEQAQEAHAFIRQLLGRLYSKDFAAAVRIQYGGSVKPDNVKELMSMPDIDGALVGGAALKADSFIPLMRFKT